MPIKKKNATRNKVIIWTIVIALLILMVISFPVAQHTTEVVLFP